MRVSFPQRRNLHRNVFVGFESGFAIICALSVSRYKVHGTEMSRDGSTGFIRISW